jgi:hypothetical protein
VKTSQKLDFGRFAEALVERGLVDREVLNHVLHQCQTTGALLPNLLVMEGFVADWELSKVVCEIFNLPFLTVKIYPPREGLAEEIDPDFLRHYSLVPLDRYGKLMTVAMPGLVSKEILDALRNEKTHKILPVVGTVLTNREWLDEHIIAPAMPTAPEKTQEDGLPPLTSQDEEWTNIFDAGDEAVQHDLGE